MWINFSSHLYHLWRHQFKRHQVVQQSLESSIRKGVHFGYRPHSDGENWKKTWSVFGAKMVLKRPTIPTIDQGPISTLYPLFKPNFFRLTESIWRVEDDENKRAERKERKWARKNNRKGPAQKKRKSKFWLMRMHQIRILYIFVPIFREIYPHFGKKSLFSKFKAHLASWQPKIGLNV